MEPDDGTGLDLHRYAIFVANPSCQLELLLLRTFEVIVFEDITFVATGEDIETAVFLIGSVHAVHVPTVVSVLNRRRK